MAHSNSTQYYNLPQFDSTDKPAWLVDVNPAYAAIDTGIHAAKAAADAAQSDATQALSDASGASTAAAAADAKGSGAIASLATAFDPTATYSVSDVVIYNNLLYICSVAVVTPGAWTGSTNWTRTTMEALAQAVIYADEVVYNNSTSGMTATDVQDAIDELDNRINDAVDYDTTEKVIGHWQNGKPLYEKTINWEGTIASAYQDINTNISNPDFVFFDSVIVKDNALNTLCFPYIGNNTNIVGYIMTSGDKIRITVDSFWNTHKLYFSIKLRYTKTTD